MLNVAACPERINWFCGCVVMTGRFVTVTFAVAWFVAPFGSTTVSSTDVVPSSYGPAGDCVIVSGSPSGSDDPSSIDALAVPPAPAATVTLLARAIGNWLGVPQGPRHTPVIDSVYGSP